jgi:succinyl-diaminopimelate desuccinylase
MPGVEFGPSGGGHHGPEEWVSIESLAQYRQALVDFVRAMPSIGTRTQPNLRIA